MPEPQTGHLREALTRIMTSRHPYVNATLKRLAKACQQRLGKEIPTPK